MHISLDTTAMRYIFSFASFGKPIPVPITYEEGYIKEEEVQIDPWTMRLYKGGENLNLKVETDTANPGKDIAWLWQ
ncbi:MAG: hypothetical protein QG644_507 [Patescibacteria group bacterium]|nr:hypothetical protein [Candidatus Paceibacterota bacterium]MDQ5922799.1 hypothetical protein [Patescibacteria group bacterium]